MSALLAFENVSVRLGPREAVREASFTIEPGEAHVLLGANGAGKSTHLRAALGLLAPSAGRVLLGGADPLHLSSLARARRAAYLPQHLEAVWPIEVDALVALGRFTYGAAPHRLAPADREAVERALRQADMIALRRRPLDTLSGGERTRAHLARALAQSAPLLVLDEPTAALDPAHVLAVLDAIKAHTEAGGAVLFSTHDVAFAARAASTAHVLAAGAVIAAGAPGDVLTPEVLKQAYGRPGALGAVNGLPAAAFS